MTPAKRTYYVRAKVWRGRDGFHVGSRGGGGWPISIWVPTRDQAERIKVAAKAGEWATVDDIVLEQP